MMVARCARFSCCFATARFALSLSSCRGRSMAFCERSVDKPNALHRRRPIARRISAETDKIFYHPAKFSADTDVADQNKLLVDLETRRRFLSAGARINRANVHV